MISQFLLNVPPQSIAASTLRTHLTVQYYMSGFYAVVT